MNIIYLIIVFVSVNGNMTSQRIPQMNMQQCQVNVKNYSQKETNMGEGYNDHKTTAYCIVGRAEKEY